MSQLLLLEVPCHKKSFRRMYSRNHSRYKKSVLHKTSCHNQSFHRLYSHSRYHNHNLNLNLTSHNPSHNPYPTTPLTTCSAALPSQPVHTWDPSHKPSLHHPTSQVISLPKQYFPTTPPLPLTSHLFPSRSSRSLKCNFNSNNR